MENDKIINLKFRKYSPLEFWIYYILYTPATFGFVLFFLFILLLLIDALFGFSLIPSFLQSYLRTVFLGNGQIIFIFLSGVIIISAFIGLFLKFSKSYRAQCIIDEISKTFSFQIDEKSYSDIKFVKVFWYLPVVLFRVFGRHGRLRLPVYALWLRYETMRGETGYLLLEDESFLDIKLNRRYQKIVRMEDYSRVTLVLSNFGLLPVSVHSKFSRRKKFLSLFFWIFLSVCISVMFVAKFRSKI